MTTYKPLQAGATPTLGTSGAAVSAYQTQLNNANKGVAGYVPLAVDGKYGPLTQAASQFKAPVATPTVPTPTSTLPDLTGEKFARGTSKYDTQINDLQSKIDKNTVTPRSTEELFSQNKQMAQGVIDAITAEFDRQIEAQNQTNSGYNDVIRARNVSEGLGGSDFGTTNRINQEEKNKHSIDLINKERTAKIQEILLGLGSKSSEQARQERLDYVAKLGNDIKAVRELKEASQARAKETVQNLARQNVTLDKFKSGAPDEYQKILDEYGGSEMDLNGVWNESLPDGLKVKYESKIIQGANGMATVLQYGINPQTGQLTQQEFPLNVNYNTLQGVKPITVDGRLFAIETDANGNEIARPLTSKTVTTKTTTTPSVKLTGTQKSKLIGTNLKNEEINTIESDINKYGLDAVLNNPYLTAPQKTTIKAIFAPSKTTGRSL